MNIAKTLTDEIAERNLWRGGMLRRRECGNLVLRCIDNGMVECDESGEMVRCIVWQSEGAGDPFSVLPDESWLIDLDDDATDGALWGLLRDAVKAHPDYASPRRGVEGVTLLNCWSIRVVDGHSTHTPGDGPWMETHPEPLASALLRVWGVKVESC